MNKFKRRIERERRNYYRYVSITSGRSCGIGKYKRELNLSLLLSLIPDSIDIHIKKNIPEKSINILRKMYSGLKIIIDEE